jgi:hypothetical protein
MGSIGTGVFVIGLLSFLVGFRLLLLGVKSHDETYTEWRKFTGPIWFILMAFGFVLIIAGLMMPI